MVFKDVDFLEFIGVKNSPFKTPLNLAKIYDTLDVFKNDLHGLRSHFKKWRVSILDAIHEDDSDIIVSGWTLTPGINGKDYVNVKMFIHTSVGFNSYKFDDNSWDNFKTYFLQVLAHEFIHFRQAHNSRNLEFKDVTLVYKQSKNDNIEADRGYHSCIQEIEAYGHCLYMETLWYPCKYKDFKKRLVRTPTYIMLMKVYNGDHTCEVVKAHKASAIKWKLKYEKAFQ